MQELLSLGFSRLELSVHLTEAMLSEVYAMVSSGRVTVGSLHNYCPVPPGVDPKGDLWSVLQLSSTDTAERAAAVVLTKTTIDWAARLNARSVVLHLGTVPFHGDKYQVFDLVRQGRSDEAKQLLRGHLMQRSITREPYLESLILSLQELACHAENAGIMLGCENRFFYAEIPAIDEFKTIFECIKSPVLGYWHDTGHAHVAEVLGIATQEEFLDMYGDKLVGMHIHDALGLDDHRALGKGEIDFARLRRYILPDTQLVLEVHGRASAQDLIDSRRTVENWAAIACNTDS
ncbi:MAG TPA: TIM barrel protein [Armatimonadota bacterium]